MLIKLRIMMSALIMVLAAWHVVPAQEANNCAPTSLINAQDLKVLIEKNEVITIAVQRPEKYILGHIPGAQRIWPADYQTNEQGPDIGVSAAQYIQLMKQLGIGRDSIVVLYCERNNYNAAQFWLLMKYHGHKDVRLLNGGYTGWTDAGYASEMLPPPASPAGAYNIAEENKTLLAVKEDLANPSADTVIIDARSRNEFLGKRQASPAAKAGHIPGAVWIEWKENLDNRGYFKTIAELKDLYESRGVTSDKKILIYCHSGARSAHSLFTLTQILGYKNVRSYAGAWVEWSRTDLPIETGPDN